MKVTYKNISKKDYITKHFELLNVTQPNKSRIISEAELELLREFLMLPSDKFSYMRFATVGRNKVWESLKEKGKAQSKQSINNKIYSLIDKRILYRDVDKVIDLTPVIKSTLEAGLNNIENKKRHTVEFNFDFDNATEKK